MMNSYEEVEMQDEYGAEFGDPRVCPRHPEVKTSSNDGMFDADCGKCEYESYQEDQAWDHDPSNPERRYCGIIEGYISLPRFNTVACEASPEDSIPF